MKKKKRNNKIATEQRSFFFEDYEYFDGLSKSRISNLEISFNRISFIFFIFIIVSIIYSFKMIYLGSLQNKSYFVSKSYSKQIKDRHDILDRNGNIITKTITVYDAAINPSLIQNKKKLLINLQLIFPSIDIKKVHKKISYGKYFYIKKRLKDIERKKLWLLGEKSIQLERRQRRIYPHKSLFSHVIGQVDDENYGISGIEKKFDDRLRDSRLPLTLTLDTNLQFLIREELLKANEIFQTKGSAALLMNINNGEILSLISLPDYNLNARVKINDSIYLNKITKGVYELGSVFKTFTIAAGLESKKISPDTLFQNLENKIKCSRFTIAEHDPLPKNLTSSEILIRSSNIGALRIAQMIGLENFKKFLNSLELFNKIEFDLEEVGSPIPFRWGKCKLATASFGHGITTTPLQLARAYSILGNGGYKIKPTLIKNNLNTKFNEKIISSKTSDQINTMLRNVVFKEEGTANFADIEGYEVGGKTGTAMKYNSKEKINTFVALFPSSKPRHVLVVMLDQPQIAPKDYLFVRPDGKEYKNVKRNESGWNTVVTAGKIIEKIGPILAINNLHAFKNF